MEPVQGSTMLRVCERLHNPRQKRPLMSRRWRAFSARCFGGRFHRLLGDRFCRVSVEPTLERARSDAELARQRHLRHFTRSKLAQLIGRDTRLGSSESFTAMLRSS